MEIRPCRKVRSPVIGKDVGEGAGAADIGMNLDIARAGRAGLDADTLSPELGDCRSDIPWMVRFSSIGSPAVPPSRAMAKMPRPDTCWMILLVTEP